MGVSVSIRLGSSIDQIILMVQGRIKGNGGQRDRGKRCDMWGG